MSERGARGGPRGGGGGAGGRGGGANAGRGGPGGRGGNQQNRRGGGPGGRGGGAGGSGGAGGGKGPSTSAADRPKKEAILDLAKYVDKKIRVKFTGGREVVGLLKGYDQLMNLVMDEVEEYLRGDLTEKTRPLGLAVIRGTALTVINPCEGFGQISNPFLAPE